MANKIEIIVQGIDRASGVFGKIGSALGSIAFTAAAAGIALVGKTLVDSVKSAIESENAITSLNAVLTSTKGVAGVSMQAMLDHAAALQKVTKFSDETVNSAQSMLLTFTNIGANVFPQATEAVLNLAEKFGSVEGGAVQIGKALQDPIAGVTALRRVGVMLTDEQEKQVKAFMAVNDIASAQGIILGELETEFGGLARAMGNTTAGKLAILTNQLDNLKETLGGALLPLVIQATDAFTKFIESPDFQKFFDNLTKGDWKAVYKQIEGIAKELSASFGKWANDIDWVKIGDVILAGIEKIDWAAAGVAVYDAASAVWAYIGKAAQDMDLTEIVGQAWIGMSEALASAVTGQQVTLEESVAGYVAFGDGVRNAIAGWQAKTEEGILNWYFSTRASLANWQANVSTAIFSAISGAIPMITAAIAAWNAPITLELKKINKVFIDRVTIWIQQAVGAVQSAGPLLIAAIIELIAKLRAAIVPIAFSITLPNFAALAAAAAAGVALVNNAMKGIKGGKSTAGGGSAGGSTVPQMEAKALGGSVRENSTYLVGERGAELFVPNTSGMIIPNNKLGGGSSAPVVIQLTYSPAFSMANEDEFQRVLLPFIRRGIRQATSA